jgi:hypothetical protein
MAMTVTLDVAAFTLDEHTLAHHHMLTDGAITGPEVGLHGGDFDGCTRTVSDGARSGTSEGGCVWELAHDGQRGPPRRLRARGSTASHAAVSTVRTAAHASCTTTQARF